MPRSNRKRKFIVYVATSADGFIARRDGSVEWLDRPHPKGDYGMPEFCRSIDTCILGRKTYDLTVRFGMAGVYAKKKNYVFSRTLSNAASPKVSGAQGNLVGFLSTVFIPARRRSQSNPNTPQKVLPVTIEK
jgi:dihydrofolate reductase